MCSRNARISKMFRMSKLFLLYITFLVGLFFLIAPRPVNTYDFFLFSEMKLYPSTYIYFICERLVLVILAGVIANEATEYRGALWVFFWLLVADVVDFLLTYNSVWFYYHSFPVSMNVMKCLIFGLTILHAWLKPHLHY